MLSKVLTDIKKHILTGVSYMIPLIIAGATIIAISRIGSSFYSISDISNIKYGESTDSIIRLLYNLDKFGNIAMILIFPIASAFIGFSIADKLAIAPSVVGGMLANENGAGFIGAVLAGLIAGYISRFIKNKIKLPNSLISMVPVFLVPVLGTLFTVFIINYLVGIPLNHFNIWLEHWINNMSNIEQILLAAIVGAMVAFDLGGPINKLAVTVSMFLLINKIYIPNTAAQVSIIIPPLGLGLSTIIAPNRYSKDLRYSGKLSIKMGLIGMSEGAIPFKIKSPRVVTICNVIGCALGSAIAVGLKASNKVPISGFYGWIIVEKWYIYILAVFVGALFVAISTAIFKDKVVEEGDDFGEDDWDEDEWES